MHLFARTITAVFFVFTPALTLAQSESAPPPDPLGTFSFAELADRIRPSLVTIRRVDRDGNQNRLGTGFVVSPSGLIATNLHVIGEGRPFTVETAGNDQLHVVAVEASDHFLDLALIRVTVNDDSPLSALPLSEVKAVQGTPVLAMGNPWGLEKSAVGGIVSAFRDVGGQELIQLAMPIEPGNSGGPVVDRSGRVVGIVNMKSAIQQNVAFAIQSASLQLLLDKPNPIAIEHWVRLGTLNKAEWTPKFGATWRQHGGRISVSGIGQGFGGRSLCLLERDIPSPPFELAVSVRLDDVSGAAGLVFHADGNDQHYGFYPSNGRLRLSCFRGPTAYSWQVLRDEPSEFYRQGEWNELKVRVEPDKLKCFVNDQLVFESTDTSFTNGKVGLAKFRHTVAEFKNFRVGSELSSEITLAESLKQVATTIDQLPQLGDLTVNQLGDLVKSAPASLKVLQSRAQALERQADKLRQEAEQHRRLAADVHGHNIAAQVGALVHGEGEIDLLRGALLIAQLDEEEINVESYTELVDAMAQEVLTSLREGADEQQKLDALCRIFFAERGYHGSRYEYYHRANSFINRVIDDREGLPITLSVLFMEVGRRLGLAIEGVGLPGHFVVRFVPLKGDPLLIDVFDGGKKLTDKEAAKLVETRAGREMTTADLKPADNAEILLRMLRNLYGVAEAESDRESMLRFLEAMVAIAPDSVQYRGLRAVLRRSTGRKSAAIADLDWILAKAPADIDLDEIRRMREVFERP
jgi:regulator of sirC expression with transglutaminase-like and TPR domain